MVAALITAASLPRCEIVNGRRPIPWVRNSRGFFIEEDPVFNSLESMLNRILIAEISNMPLGKSWSP